MKSNKDCAVVHFGKPHYGRCVIMATDRAVYVRCPRGHLIERVPIEEWDPAHWLYERAFSAQFCVECSIDTQPASRRRRKMRRSEFAICLLLILALTLFLYASAHAQASATDTAATGDSASATVTPPPPPAPTDPPAASDGEQGHQFWLARAIAAIFDRVRIELVGQVGQCGDKREEQP